MKYSLLFSKTQKETPKDEISNNAILLFRAGYIYKEMAGAYAYLPLGLRVLEKIKNIVREEMNKIGGQEILMTTLQRKELWEVTNRWDDKNVDVWFKSMLKNGTEVGFGWSHEEPISDMMKNYIKSYRDLPVYVYQFQTKLRNELRAKSGVMRGREFLMNDMYSFTKTEEDHNKFYNSAIEAYHQVFKRLGLGKDTFLTFASGGAFTQFSHEFQTITEAGEDIIYLDREKRIGINEEVYTPEVVSQLGVNGENLERVKTAEVGNIFSFGAAKSNQLELMFNSSEGIKPVILGSYGIGVSRLMGVIAEKFSDKKGLVWPESIAPFKVHLTALNMDDDATANFADTVYKKLLENKIEVLFDDRVGVSAGEKLADADLIGIPVRLVISARNQTQIEYKVRNSENVELFSLEELLNKTAV